MVRMIKVEGKAIWIMCILFLLSDVVSSLTTYVGITYLGLSEQNPFMAEMFTKYGIVPALIIATLITFALGVGVTILGTHPRTQGSFNLPSFVGLSIFAALTLTDALGNIIAILEVM